MSSVCRLAVLFFADEIVRAAHVFVRPRLSRHPWLTTTNTLRATILTDNVDN